MNHQDIQFDDAGFWNSVVDIYNEMTALRVAAGERTETQKQVYSALEVGSLYYLARGGVPAHLEAFKVDWTISYSRSFMGILCSRSPHPSGLHPIYVHAWMAFYQSRATALDSGKLGNVL